MSYAVIFAPDTSGLTTAQNATAGSASAAIALSGGSGTIAISVGANPIYFRFGPVNATAVSSTNGFYLPAGFVGRFNIPPKATHLYHIRSGASDSTISVQACEGGI